MHLKLYLQTLTDRSNPRFFPFILAVIGSAYLFYHWHWSVSKWDPLIAEDVNMWLPGVFVLYLIAFISAHRELREQSVGISIKGDKSKQVLGILLGIVGLLYFGFTFLYFDPYPWVTGLISLLLLISASRPLGKLRFRVVDERLQLSYGMTMKELLSLDSWELQEGRLILHTGERKVELDGIPDNPKNMDQVEELLEGFRRKANPST